MPWEEISVDIPTFYKSYSDLSSLASALGDVPEQSLSNFDNAPVNKTILAVYNNPANAPISGSIRGYVSTYKTSGKYYQKYFDCASNATYTRGRGGSDETWGVLIPTIHFAKVQKIF